MGYRQNEEGNYKCQKVVMNRTHLVMLIANNNKI